MYVSLLRRYRLSFTTIYQFRIENNSVDNGSSVEQLCDWLVIDKQKE